jgi:hypothetical protein
VGVSTDGTGRVGSNEAGYERGSVRRDPALERDEIEELEDAIDGAMSLFIVESVDVDMLDAMDSREWYDDVVDVRYDGAAEERKDEAPEAKDMVDDV